MNIMTLTRLAPPETRPFSLQAWRPRPAAFVYALAKLLALFAIPHLLRDALFDLESMFVGFDSAASAPVTAETGSKQVLASSIPSPGQMLQCYALLFLIANLGFAYTSFVTTARDSCFRGRHGGYRDVCWLNAALPLMALWGLVPYTHLLFPRATPGEGLSVVHTRGTGFVDRGSGAVSQAAAFDGDRLISFSNETMAPSLTASNEGLVIGHGGDDRLTAPSYKWTLDNSVFSFPSFLQSLSIDSETVPLESFSDLSSEESIWVRRGWWGVSTTQPALASSIDSSRGAVQGEVSPAAITKAIGNGARRQSIANTATSIQHTKGSKTGIVRRIKQALISFAARYVAPVYPALVLCAGFFAGTHLLYATRVLRLDGSVSGKTVRALLANHDIAGLTAIATKVVLISGAIRLHILWLVAADLLLHRVGAYVACVLLFWAVSHSIRDRYYVHLHHWAAGLFLSPLCHGPDWGIALFLTGLCVGQFCEGAARWSCAPLWHRHS